MTDRIERLYRCMDEQQAEAVIVSDGCNMRYLSGFSGATGYLYVSRARRVILTDSRYTTQAQEESTDFEVLEINRQAGYPVSLAKMVSEDGVKSIGFEDRVMIYSDAVELQKELPPVTWLPLGEALNNLRKIKTAEELRCIAQAEHIGDLAFSHILTVLKPGITELEVAAELEGYMKRCGAEALSFDTIVASGYHSAMPHAAPSAKKIEAGDFVTMDYGCKYNGYCSDMTRTVVVGKASEKQKEIYNIVLEAQLTSLAAVQPGKTGAEIDKIARDIIGKAGYGDYFGHGLGHSVGLFIHEEPRLSPAGNEILQPGMTVTVEPGIYLPGVGGVRIEDLTAVTENGYENFASSPKELIEI